MEVYGIIGNPVSDALSPVIHRTAFDVLDIDAVFCRFPVSAGDVEQALRGAEALEIAGLTVTMPHKETVADLEFLSLAGVADEIGVVNTVDVQDSRGYNTDGAGAVRALRENGVSIADARILVLGAGGAGKSIAYALAKRTAHVDIANIAPAPARDIAAVARRAGGSASGHSLDQIDSLLSDADVLINATSVGMNEDRSLVDPRNLRSELVVFDIVHTPLKTRLLRDAHEAGAKTIDGASLLLYQGVEAFELWTGRDAPADAMGTALRSHLVDRG